ncbi:HEAT repeat domain-containing protein [Nitrosopumilus sp. K4]|uniref:HEAT repeat domain-containing protein n=1 Tax=Nitrosopumilus sp. K4 TaxID=2795383 RepID=UPI001BAD9B73|nr:HEAT repeat domain-containing protein [Nitrosopumilus sp. K4]QUC64092.1 HEAT repeat domain-containing protein [Nitrosopumilus sp. K4]
MSTVNIPDEFDKTIKKLPLEERFRKLEEIFKTSKDESERWDAVWLGGEIPVEVNLQGPLFEKMTDLFAWVLKNDPNDVVRHEVCYQIAARNMRRIIPELAHAANYDPSPLVRHEATECLMIIRATDQISAIERSLKDENESVRNTAELVLKRMKRYKSQFDAKSEWVSI